MLTEENKVKNVISAYSQSDAVWASYGWAFSIDRIECKPLEIVDGLDLQFPDRAPWSVWMGVQGVAFMDNTAPDNMVNTSTMREMSSMGPINLPVVTCKRRNKNDSLEENVYEVEYKYVPMNDNEYSIRRRRVVTRRDSTTTPDDDHHHNLEVVLPKTPRISTRALLLSLVSIVVLTGIAGWVLLSI